MHNARNFRQPNTTPLCITSPPHFVRDAIGEGGVHSVKLCFLSVVADSCWRAQVHVGIPITPLQTHLPRVKANAPQTAFPLHGYNQYSERAFAHLFGVSQIHITKHTDPFCNSVHSARRPRASASASPPFLNGHVKSGMLYKNTYTAAHRVFCTTRISNFPASHILVVCPLVGTCENFIVLFRRAAKPLCFTSPSLIPLVV
jgi:hypothetical protein